jgi:hypothetical protein
MQRPDATPLAPRRIVVLSELSWNVTRGRRAAAPASSDWGAGRREGRGRGVGRCRRASCCCSRRCGRRAAGRPPRAGPCPPPAAATRARAGRRAAGRRAQRAARAGTHRAAAAAAAVAAACSGHGDRVAQARVWRPHGLCWRAGRGGGGEQLAPAPARASGPAPPSNALPTEQRARDRASGGAAARRGSGRARLRVPTRLARVAHLLHRSSVIGCSTRSTWVKRPGVGALRRDPAALASSRPRRGVRSAGSAGYALAGPNCAGLARRRRATRRRARRGARRPARRPRLSMSVRPSARLPPASVPPDAPRAQCTRLHRAANARGGAAVVGSARGAGGRRARSPGWVGPGLGGEGRSGAAARAPRRHARGRPCCRAYPPSRGRGRHNRAAGPRARAPSRRAARLWPPADHGARRARGSS